MVDERKLTGNKEEEKEEAEDKEEEKEEAEDKEEERTRRGRRKNKKRKKHKNSMLCWQSLAETKFLRNMLMIGPEKKRSRQKTKQKSEEKGKKKPSCNQISAQGQQLFLISWSTESYNDLLTCIVL